MKYRLLITEKTKENYNINKLDIIEKIEISENNFGVLLYNDIRYTKDQIVNNVYGNFNRHKHNTLGKKLRDLLNESDYRCIKINTEDLVYLLGADMIEFSLDILDRYNYDEISIFYTSEQ